MKPYRKPPLKSFINYLSCLGICSFSIAHSQEGVLLQEGSPSFLPETIVETPNSDPGQKTTPEIRFSNELKSQERLSGIEVGILSIKQEQLEKRSSKMEYLKSLGLATSLQVELSKIQIENAKDRAKAETEYQKLVDIIQNEADQLIDFTHEEGIDGPVASNVQFRVPGLSLTIGGREYFTATVSIDPELEQAINDYAACRLKQEFVAPNKQVIQEYYQDRHERLQSLSFARRSEIETSQYQLVSLRQMEELANERFLNGLQRYRDADVSQRLLGFWLLVDSRLTEPSSNLVCDSALHLAWRKTKAVPNLMLANAELQKASLDYDRMKKLVRHGHANDAEFKKAKLSRDLATLDLEFIEASREVASLAYRQIAKAYSGEPVQTKELPSVQDAESWSEWFRSQPMASRDDAIRFLEIAKNSFKVDADKRIGKRHVDFQGKVAALYQSIPSVQSVELEQQRLALLKNNAVYLASSEGGNDVLLQLRQWSQRKSQPVGRMTSEMMDEIIKIGREVLKKREKVATLNYDKQRTKYLYDLDRFETLQAMKSRGKGAVNGFELSRAYNQAKQSQGATLSAKRQLMSIKEELELNEYLFSKGAIHFDSESGLRLNRFDRETVAALQSLTVLKEGVDDGRLLQLEAGLANLDLALSELNHLVQGGHASKIEIEAALAKRKQLENAIALERAKEEPLKPAFTLVEAIESGIENQIQNEPIIVNLK